MEHAGCDRSQAPCAHSAKTSLAQGSRIHRRPVSANGEAGPEISVQVSAVNCSAQILLQYVKTARVRGADHPDTCFCLRNLALAYRGQGLYEDAEVLEEQALEGIEKAFGKDHPDASSVVASLALTYHRQGKLEEAKGLVTRLLEGIEKIGERHPAALVYLNNLAEGFEDTQRWDVAERIRKQVLAIQTEVLGEDHEDTLIAKSNLAMVYRKTGRSEGAKELMVDVVERSKRQLGDEHPSTLVHIYKLALVEYEVGDPVVAVWGWTQIVGKMKDVLGEKDEYTVDCERYLALARKEGGLL